ncbi:hypothetical protein LP417_25070 [Polaromonas sp. P1-6]|nr:hypothetical protein LP417_25070 [Polaromonas sp. P1-6]
MNSEYTLWLSVLALVLSLSGWAKVFYDFMANRVNIRGEALGIIRSGWHGQFPEPKTAFFTYVHLTNDGKSEMHIRDFVMEIKMAGKWTTLERVYASHTMEPPPYSTDDPNQIQINDFSKNHILRKQKPVMYGTPLHGWIMFAGDLKLHHAKIDRYRLTTIDSSRKRHVTNDAFDRTVNINLLQEIADVRIPKSAQGTAHACSTPTGGMKCR